MNYYKKDYNQKTTAFSSSEDEKSLQKESTKRVYRRLSTTGSNKASRFLREHPGRDWMVILQDLGRWMVILQDLGRWMVILQDLGRWMVILQDLGRWMVILQDLGRWMVILQDLGRWMVIL